MRTITRSFAHSILFTGVAVSLFALVLLPKLASAAPMQMTGWAWSAGTDSMSATNMPFMGWISFSNTNLGESVPYGVWEESTTGVLSGYAWSSNLGWISFNAADVAGCPSGTCTPQVNLATQQLSGWARACSAFTSTGACVGTTDPGSGNWDGWIALNTISQNTDCSWSGYGWGSTNIGVLHFGAHMFAGINHGVKGPPNDAACTPTSSLGITVSPSTYSVTLPSSTVTATYTLANGTSANTTCRLLDNNQVPLGTGTYSSCTGSLSVVAPTTAGNYGYYIQANKAGLLALSNSFTVTVNPNNPPSCTWSAWGTCSGACGGGAGTETRTQSPFPACTGVETRGCTNNQACALTPPDVQIHANPRRVPKGGQTTIDWSSSGPGTITCRVDRAEVINGVLQPAVLNWRTGSSNSGVVDPITAQTIYTLTCENGTTPVTKKVVVNYIPGQTEF